MNAKNQQDYLAVKKNWRALVHQTNAIKTIELPLYLETHKRLFSIFQPNPYYLLLFDLYQGEMAEISPEITDILGYPLEQVNMQLFMEHMHPADQAYFLSFENHAAQFFSHIPFDKIDHYKVQYDLRLKNRDEEYARILFQYVLLNDADNLCHSFHIHTDITHLKPDGIPTFSIIGIDGEPSYCNIQQVQVFTKSNDLFTKREWDILKCITEGKSSKQIADQLFISIHTVNCHRKNILAKAKVKTPMELLNKAIREGWM